MKMSSNTAFISIAIVAAAAAVYYVTKKSGAAVSAVSDALSNAATSTGEAIEDSMSQMDWVNTYNPVAWLFNGAVNEAGKVDAQKRGEITDVNDPNRNAYTDETFL